MSTRQRFRGQIAGVGTTSGTRVVVGHWRDTPLGAFSDAMVETAAGHRVLLAPSQEAAHFIAATYTFDEVRLEPFAVREVGHAAARDGADDGGRRWEVRSPSLELDVRFGRRTGLGRLLRLVPDRVGTAPWFCALTDPVARVVLRGVRTRGTAGGRRTEWYGATDAHAVTTASGTFDGAWLGELAPVDPPCRFGFSSTPRRPSVTSVVTTVQLA